MRFTGKTLTVLLIIVMIVNAVGIAQVSHICKMAVSSVTVSHCDKTNGNTPSCCKSPKESENQKKPAGESCCKNVIKYYHQKVNTTLQQSLKVQPLTFFISLYFVAITVPDVNILTNFTGSDVFHLPKSGKTIILDIQSFLI